MKLKQQNKIKESRRHNNFKIWVKIKEIRNKAITESTKPRAYLKLIALTKCYQYWSK